MLEQFVSFAVGDAVLAYGPTILFRVFLIKIIFCSVIRVLSMPKSAEMGGV